jgi:hypothetical protein
MTVPTIGPRRAPFTADAPQASPRRGEELGRTPFPGLKFEPRSCGDATAVSSIATTTLVVEECCVVCPVPPRSIGLLISECCPDRFGTGEALRRLPSRPLFGLSDNPSTGAFEWELFCLKECNSGPPFHRRSLGGEGPKSRGPRGEGRTGRRVRIDSPWTDAAGTRGKARNTKVARRTSL